MALKITGKSLSFKTEKISNFFSKFYSYIFLFLLLLVVGFGLFMTYQAVYDTFIVEKNINPSDIKSKEEKIDLTRYTSVSNKLDGKKAHKAPAASGNF